MTIPYFYVKDGQQIGPLNRKQLDDLNLDPSTLVWYYGLTGWIKYKDVPKDIAEDDIQTKGLKKVEKHHIFALCKKKREKPISNNHIYTQRSGSRKSLIAIIIIVIVTILIVGGVIKLVSLVNSKSYPEYVTSFSAKAKMYLGKPNNSLCQELVEKAQEANAADMTELEHYYYDAALEVGGDDDILFTISEFYTRSDVKEYGQGLEVLSKIKNQQRTDVVANEAWCYLQTHKMDKAIQLAQLAFMQDSTNELSTKTLYCAYAAKENWEDCIKWAKKSLELQPSFGWTYYFMAYAQYKLGYRASAQESYLKAVELDPSIHDYYWWK